MKKLALFAFTLLSALGYDCKNNYRTGGLR